MLLWVGCIAGALQDYDYASKLAKAGFGNIDVEPTRIYGIEDARAFLSGQGVDVDAIAPQVQGKFMSALIRAIKPANCCTPISIRASPRTEPACGTLSISGRLGSVPVNETAETEPETQRTGVKRRWNRGSIGTPRIATSNRETDRERKFFERLNRRRGVIPQPVSKSLQWKDLAPESDIETNWSMGTESETPELHESTNS
jgi:hypothetical protein